MATRGRYLFLLWPFTPTLAELSIPVSLLLMFRAFTNLLAGSVTAQTS